RSPSQGMKTRTQKGTACGGELRTLFRTARIVALVVVLGIRAARGDHLDAIDADRFVRDVLLLDGRAGATAGRRAGAGGRANLLPGTGLRLGCGGCVGRAGLARYAAGAGAAAGRGAARLRAPVGLGADVLRAGRPILTTV